MNVKWITPFTITGRGRSSRIGHGYPLIFLAFFVCLRRVAARRSSYYGKIPLTTVSSGRRHGPARITGGPESHRAARVAVPEPAPRAGARRGLPGRGLLRRPRRGAGQIRDGAPRQRGRRTGYRDRGGVRVLPAVVLPGSRRAGRLRPGRAGTGQARAPRRPQAHRADPRLGRGTAGGRSRPESRPPGRAHRRGVPGPRAPPLPR